MVLFLLLILADCLSACLSNRLFFSCSHLIIQYSCESLVRLLSSHLMSQDHIVGGEEFPTAFAVFSISNHLQTSKARLMSKAKSQSLRFCCLNKYNFILNVATTALLCPATGPFAHPRLPQFALKMLRICQFVKFLGCGGRWLAVSLPLLLYRISRSQLRCAFTHQTHLATTCCSFLTSVITGGSSWILILNIRRSYSCRVLLRQFKFVA